MSNPIIDNLYEQYKDLTQEVEKTQDLINFGKQAGLDVTQYQANLRNSKIKLDQWRSALKQRGYEV